LYVKVTPAGPASVFIDPVPNDNAKFPVTRFTFSLDGEVPGDGEPALGVDVSPGGDPTTSVGEGPPAPRPCFSVNLVAGSGIAGGTNTLLFAIAGEAARGFWFEFDVCTDT
jgi:hypothetical protein